MDHDEHSSTEISLPAATTSEAEPPFPAAQRKRGLARKPAVSETFWERVNDGRWGRYVSEAEKEAVLKAHARCGQRGTFLEVGCDGGRWSKLLVDLGWRAVCTDVSEKSIGICQRRVPEARCVLVRPEDTTLPCETGSVSLVLCIEVIPVVRTTWFVREAARVLSPGGCLVGVFNNKRSLRGATGRVWHRFRRTFDWYAVSYPVWRAGLLAAGFRMVEETGLCWFPFSRKSNSALVPLFVRLEARLGLRRLPSISPWIVFLAEKAPRSQSRLVCPTAAPQGSAR